MIDSDRLRIFYRDQGTTLFTGSETLVPIAVTGTGLDKLSAGQKIDLIYDDEEDGETGIVTVAVKNTRFVKFSDLWELSQADLAKTCYTSHEAFVGFFESYHKDIELTDGSVICLFEFDPPEYANNVRALYNKLGDYVQKIPSYSDDEEPEFDTGGDTALEEELRSARRFSLDFKMVLDAEGVQQPWFCISFKEPRNEAEIYEFVQQLREIIGPHGDEDSIKITRNTALMKPETDYDGYLAPEDRPDLSSAKEEKLMEMRVRINLDPTLLVKRIAEYEGEVIDQVASIAMNKAAKKPKNNMPRPSADRVRIPYAFLDRINFGMTNMLIVDQPLSEELAGQTVTFWAGNDDDGMVTEFPVNVVGVKVMDVTEIPNLEEHEQELMGLADDDEREEVYMDLLNAVAEAGSDVYCIYFAQPDYTPYLQILENNLGAFLSASLYDYLEGLDTEFNGFYTNIRNPQTAMSESYFELEIKLDDDKECDDSLKDMICFAMDQIGLDHDTSGDEESIIVKITGEPQEIYYQMAEKMIGVWKGFVPLNEDDDASASGAGASGPNDGGGEPKSPKGGPG